MATPTYQTSFIVKKGLVVESTVTSTSTTSGAAIISGGVGIAGNIIAGGTIIAGGVRTASTTTAPLNATPGDIWYNTATDDIYRYTTDGTSTYWLDITGPSIANGSYIFTGGAVANTTYFNQTYNQGTGLLQVNGTSTVNGGVTAQSLYVQGGNNSLLNSQTFGGWNAAALTTSSQTAPDGSATALQIVQNGIITQHFLGTTGTSAGTVLSVYVQGAGSTSFSLNQNTSTYGVTFNPATGLITSVSGGSASVSNVGNGWYRLTFVSTQTSNLFYMWPNGLMTSYSGGSGVNVWGPQLELGYTAGAYNPTTTAALTTTNNLYVNGVIQMGVYTTATLKTITGSIGQMVSVSNSTPSSGMLAFWDATNSRWSYVFNNLAATV
jgi:hypothetical protein